MRYILFFLLCATPFGTAFSSATISGAISNLDATEVQFSWSLFTGDMHIHKAVLESGEFSTNVPIERPTFLWLQIGDEWTRLFLSPNDDVKFEADYKSLAKTIKFSGKGSECNNYLANYTKIPADAGPEMEKDFNMSPAEFMERSNKFTKFQLDELEGTEIDLSRPSTFEKVMKTELIYGEKLEQVRYLQENYSRSALVDTIDSKELAAFKEMYDNNDLHSLVSESYRRFLYAQTVFYRLPYYTAKGKIPPIDQDSLFWPQRAYTIVAENYIAEVADYFGAEMLVSYMNEGTFERAEAFYKHYNAVCTNADYKAYITDRYNTLKQHFENPNITDGININAAKKEDGSDASFEELIAPFKGKVIYIDMWASWCSPCRYEMKNSAEMRDEYSKKGVVFMYLSIDETEKVWMTGISSMQIKGEHYLLSAEQDAQILENLFKTPGIPHYALIDKDGKIVDANAKRPSDPELLKELDTLLAAPANE